MHTFIQHHLSIHIWRFSHAWSIGFNAAPNGSTWMTQRCRREMVYYWYNETCIAVRGNRIIEILGDVRLRMGNKTRVAAIGELSDDKSRWSGRLPTTEAELKKLGVAWGNFRGVLRVNVKLECTLSVESVLYWVVGGGRDYWAYVWLEICLSGIFEIIILN